MHLFTQSLPFPLRPLVLALSLAAMIQGSRAADRLNIVVHAGQFDRSAIAVQAKLPNGTRLDAASLTSAGKPVEWQPGQDNSIWFRMAPLLAGTSATYEFGPGKSERSPGQGTARLRAGRRDRQIEFTSETGGAPGRLLMAYQAEPGDFPRADIKPAFRRGGYLHPIRTLSGRLVTDDFPPNHVHHHGVWWAWTHTEFDGRTPDFWNMGDGKGRVEFVSTGEPWSGPLAAGVTARHRFVDLTSPQPVTVLNETWHITTLLDSPSPGMWMFDLVSEQECATTRPLRLPTYRYGGIGVRGNWAWNGKDATHFLTANGETDREKGHATRARWCDMAGDVDGQRAGIAILSHPGNFRHPEPMRIHPTEPFFNFAPQQAGEMEIKPGTRHVSRYRFVIHDGPAERTALDRVWNDYAHPPEIVVTPRL